MQARPTRLIPPRQVVDGRHGIADIVQAGRAVSAKPGRSRPKICSALPSAVAGGATSVLVWRRRPSLILTIQNHQGFSDGPWVSGIGQNLQWPCRLGRARPIALHALTDLQKPEVPARCSSPLKAHGIKNGQWSLRERCLVTDRKPHNQFLNSYVSP